MTKGKKKTEMSFVGISLLLQKLHVTGTHWTLRIVSRLLTQAQVRGESWTVEGHLVVKSTSRHCPRAEFPEPAVSGSQLPAIPSLQ